MRSRLFVILLTLMMVSCKSVEYIPVPVEHTKTEYTHDTDTIIQKDSVYIKEWMKNDTVFLTEYKYKYLYKYSTDTIIRCDSVPVIHEVEVPVKFVPDYYKKINKAFWTLASLLLLFLGYKIKKMI